MEEINIMDFLPVLWRRKKLFCITAATVFLISIISALHWSNYRSTATVEVALPEVAMQVINEDPQSAREALADLRISYLQQKVFSTGSLVEIITKFNLYAAARQTRPIADVAEAMRNKIFLDYVGSSSVGGRPQSSQRSTIAFTLSFNYSDPLLAQQVTNELVSRFLDEDIKQRQGQTRETTSFLAAQIKSLESSLAEQEKKIAEFRSQYGESRPESLAFNQSVMSSLLMGVQGLDAQISSNFGALGALQSQLVSLDPYSAVIGGGQVLTTPTTQLRAAKTDYAALSAKYGPDHPDVIKARRQVESLSIQTRDKRTRITLREDVAPIRALIRDTEAKLEAAKNIKGPENPDVKALQTQLQGLREQLKEKQQKVDALALIKQDADNPAYLAVVSQIQTVIERGRALEQQRASLQEQLDRYQKAVTDNPEAEKKMAELSRDYANSQERYRQLQAKKMEAEMSETIEKDRVGQRLLIINPPELPTSTQPSRRIFVLAGFVLALVCGAASVIGAQLLRQGVIGPRHLSSIVGLPPLVVIPHIETEAEKSSTMRLRIRVGLISICALVFFVAIFSYVVMPLDVFVSVVAMRLGIY
ncbi:MAG: hypothetical protein PHD48_05170 [Alphaproteobacteria bacterium]|nr:hypothetical protein [Alphaproteobacteria bacterium]